MENVHYKIKSDFKDELVGASIKMQVESVIDSIKKELNSHSEVQVKIAEEGPNQYAVGIKIFSLDQIVAIRKIGKKIIPTLFRAKRATIRKLKKLKNRRFSKKKMSVRTALKAC